MKVLFTLVSLILSIACTHGAPNAIVLSVTVAARSLTGCFDTVFEPECDAKIHIWYNTNTIIPNWRILASTSVISNNNNPVWSTLYPIPSDTTELKFQVVDVDAGIDDILGDTPPLKVEDILDAGSSYSSPIGGGEGSGVVVISPKLN